MWPWRPRGLLRGPVLALAALGALHGHAKAAGGAAAGGRVAAVRQVREAGGARVFRAVARDFGLLAGIAGVAGVAGVEHLLRAGQVLLGFLWHP